jgi:hypothetical protein
MNRKLIKMTIKANVVSSIGVFLAVAAPQMVLAYLLLH